MKKRMNKKGADYEEIVRIISWIAFFALILIGLYFLIQKFTKGG